ncbi:MAG: hypothetical protein SV775_01670 [Thermodesulfobacteriota bacterium]|nr:hypothetical protein [Thermodesulfobacteriota bacterium]
MCSKPLFSLILVLLLSLGQMPAGWGFEGGVNKDILKGIHLLYDEQFNDAENVFKKMVVESSKKPEGYFYLAMVSWSRLASGFWSPEVVEEFKERIDSTIRVATKRIENNGSDSYDYFYLGGALGFKGRFELMRGKWLSAFFAANDAVDAFKICLKIDPGNKDVLLCFGTFDYYTARFSGLLRFFTRLFIHKGSKEEGLNKLNVAANEATYSATESKSMLLHIYLFLEQDFPKALPLAEELEAEYDENPRYKLLKGLCYIVLGMDDEYEATVHDLRLKSLNSSSLIMASLWNRRVLYLEAINDLYHARYSEARSRITAILDQPDPENDPWMIAWPVTKLGISYDLENSRKEALKYYHQVLEMENGAGAQFLVEEYMDQPPNAGSPFLGY